MAHPTGEHVASHLNPELAGAFAADPFAALANQSRALFDVYRDPALDGAEKDRQLDGYFRTIVELDRATYPETEIVQKGVPLGYIPDGFVDMGGLPSEIPAQRYKRAMNYVDTYGILHAHKDMFAKMFGSFDLAKFDGDPRAELKYQQTVLWNIALEIWTTMPHGEPDQAELGGILPVHEAARTVCQQQALVAQVLTQAFGIRTRLSKNNVAFPKDAERHGSIEAAPGGDHVSNVVVIDDAGQEALFMFDAMNPQPDKEGKWTFGLFRMKPENRLSDGRGTAEDSWIVTTANGQKRKYQEYPSMMYWKIDRSTAR